jgi:tRNA threonylcarbamoyladenosine biosynthesis protein TsaE
MRKPVRHLLVTNSPEETISIARTLGDFLRPGDVVALIGELGSGKTVFTKGIAAGLGYDEIDLVTSPTYKILNQYKGRVNINHFDAYRLEGPGDFSDIGGCDLLNNNAVSIIEWAERIADALPLWKIDIYLRVQSGSTREIEFVFPENRKHLAAVLTNARV